MTLQPRRIAVSWAKAKGGCVRLQPAAASHKGTTYQRCETSVSHVMMFSGKASRLFVASSLLWSME
jgi:hypothetical protein